MKFIFLLLFIAGAFPGKAQNGKIIEQVAYSYPDSVIERNAKYLERTLMESVDFYRITYLSDGLKVKRYLSVPKK